MKERKLIRLSSRKPSRRKEQKFVRPTGTTSYCTEVRLPMPNEAFVDWDSTAAMADGLMQWRLIQEYGHWQGWKISWHPSRTRGHYHAIVKATYPITNFTKVLVACLLRTDPNSARLNYCRVLARAPWPILLIEPVVR